jgi:E3 ubiquitin-protein ligase HUWE1
MTTEGSDGSTSNRNYSQMMSLHLRVNLLAQVYSTAGYTHGRPVNSIIQIVNSSEGRATMTDLAEMYRVCLWEAVILKGPDPLKQMGIHVSLAPSPVGDSPVQEGPSDSEGPELENSTSEHEKAVALIKQSNAKAVRILVQNLARVTTPLFQGVLNMRPKL